MSKSQCVTCRAMSVYLASVGDSETSEWYSKGDCIGHLESVRNDLHVNVASLLSNEPAKHFLTRQPMNAAEEYVQAVGWNLLRAV